MKLINTLGPPGAPAVSTLTIEQTELIHTLLSSLGLGLVVTDDTGTVLLYNNAATDILGEAIENICPQDWPMKYGLFDPDGSTLLSEAQSPLARAIGGEAADNVEILIARPGAMAIGRWCSINLRPLRNADGAIGGGVLLIQDVSERKVLAAEAARSNAALQQFASVAAHDLQEPLRSVVGFQDMLALHLGTQLDDKSAHYMAKVKGGVKRMQVLINDLLSFSRIQSKPQQLEEVDSNLVMADCLRSLSACISESGADIQVESLPLVLADASQLAQLFQNILGNAIKFAAPGRSPVVRISAQRQGAEWCFSIADNGIGIEMEFAEQVFLIFKRLHPISAYAGTGIGLAICQTIVDRHGGRMWIESVFGEGATFKFTLRAANLECLT